ncbi:uncharacterized protein FOMMEDRAFT_83798 [Fomitiporia mediterranea MF3/22]|uniref:uncharacterized protein n=1 Tax=Fomitiporia mediterranea (strain MF3/22) TaxID=694068 RepID=UPI0004407AFC|nr:uncharacterized protein FOMMEDRAFT_83798 [Fomitiporia mediterranea MF3/22]EJD03865.1 hypothetical protein FOMMEDRAFT_83798 [Fomitiporia mediterranea MF3/22]
MYAPFCFLLILARRGSNVSPTQRIITSQKGVCLDFESVSKDAKSQSKELYTWGQVQHEDIKDVTDRLAYLNFVHGALSASLATQLDASRSSMKTLRNTEKALEPRRNNRSGLASQIAKLEHDMQKGSEKRLADFKQQLAKLEAEDESAEKEVEILKRKAVADSERAKWAALREYGEKLVLLAEASAPIISALPSVPPSTEHPYTGAQTTAATRASLQQALDNFKPGSITHSFQPSVADINRTDSRSFGVTHAAELSSIASLNLPGQQQEEQADTAVHQADLPHPTGGTGASPPPFNPGALNNAPAPIPPKASPPSGQASETTTAPSVVSNVSTSPAEAKTTPLHVPEPTVAETGIPISAGVGGPGPASGSLKDLKAASPPSATPFGAAPGYTGSSGPAAGKLESAEDEKARLQREERERLLHNTGAAPPAPQKYETAEEEKKRLEKEERDRLLKEAEAKQGGSGGKDAEGDGSTPPPYQDF